MDANMVWRIPMHISLFFFSLFFFFFWGGMIAPCRYSFCIYIHLCACGDLALERVIGVCRDWEYFLTSTVSHFKYFAAYPQQFAEIVRGFSHTHFSSVFTVACCLGFTEYGVSDIYWNLVTNFKGTKTFTKGCEKKSETKLTVTL